eukprot:768477-Hanusia_phi.AAC.1
MTFALHRILLLVVAIACVSVGLQLRRCDDVGGVLRSFCARSDTCADRIAQPQLKLRLRGGRREETTAPSIHIDDLKQACNITDEDIEEEEEEDARMQDEKRLTAHDEVYTADQCIGFAEAAFEEERYDDAVDLLTVAIEEKIDNFEEDTVECVRAIILLSRSLYHKEMLSNFSDANATQGKRYSGDDSDDSDSDCFNPMQSAWTALKQAREVLERKGKDDRMLAEVFVEMSRWIMSPWSRTVEAQWEKERSRIVSAIKCMKRCLKIRHNVFAPDSKEIAQAREQLRELQDKLDREA